MKIEFFIMISQFKKTLKLFRLVWLCAYTVIFFFIFSFTSKTPSNSIEVPYNLLTPDHIFELPQKLMEVSGLTDVSQMEVGCVQDEIGTIFIYNLNKKKITSEYNIAPEGDYEGLTLVKNNFYMLRSDGILTEVTNYKDKEKKVNIYSLALKTTNNEGLCFDEKQNRLLIAAKSKVGKGKELKDIRTVYSFDLNKKALETKPVIEFSVQDLKRFAKQNKISLPEKEKKKGGGLVSALRFMPSSIAVHPKTDHIYLISAIDKMLLVLNKSGQILYLEHLEESHFIKPEGITFMQNGDMYISNEGEGGNATLLWFKTKI